MPKFISKVYQRTEDPTDPVLRAYAARADRDQINLDQFWQECSDSSNLSTTTLAALVKYDMQRQVDRGITPRAAEYLERFPQLTETTKTVVSLVYEEFCLRKESGEDLDSQQFCESYEPWRDSLLVQLAYHRELSRSALHPVPAIRFPSLGERFDRFTLIAVLGSGAMGRVYLATEDELDDRKVVIKISGSIGQEPKILAKLDHRNIVPIFALAKSDTGLRGICMPYRPGVTLEALIQRIREEALPSKARSLWEDLRASEGESATDSNERLLGWNDFPIHGSFSEAVAWIALSLSDALEYLHNQKIYHRDIKPANILLAYREGPQLLDFNLAEDPSDLQNVRASTKGGTLPYMAPEHLRAFVEVSAWNDVGRSADLYSLALVVREILTGTPPDVPSPSLSVLESIEEMIERRRQPMIPTRHFNLLVPPSLDSILEKCLAFEASDRYQSAAELSEDLRRFLARRPLAHAANSWNAERGVNWIIRNRVLASTLILVAVLLVGFSWARSPSEVADRPTLKAVDIPENPAFKAAVLQLDSARDSDWKKARESFEQLRRSYPDSAWPPLHLALTLDKLNGTNSDALNPLITEALKKSDAEAAILSRLKIHPDSSLLLASYGSLLIDLHREVEARQQLLKAIQIDPDHPNLFLLLTKLERQTNHYDQAVDYNVKAIEASIRKGRDSKTIYTQRKLLISSLARLVDDAIDKGRNVAERAKAAPHLEMIEATLSKMSTDFSKIPRAEAPAYHQFTRLLYQGLVASARGRLATDAGEFSQAKKSFDEADAFYLGAIPTISDKGQTGQKYRESIENQRKILEARRNLLDPKEKPIVSFH
jgi:serine/threonine protein kinase